MRKWTKEHAERGPLGKKEEGEESKTTTPARRGLRFALSPVPVAGGLVGSSSWGGGGVPLLFLLFLGWLHRLFGRLEGFLDWSRAAGSAWLCSAYNRTSPYPRTVPPRTGPSYTERGRASDTSTGAEVS
jgi:hypothetical protein